MVTKILCKIQLKTHNLLIFQLQVKRDIPISQEGHNKKIFVIGEGQLSGNNL